MAGPLPVWFITGTSSGFGRHIAFEALSRGHCVIASARSTYKIKDLEEAGAETIALDVTWPLPKIQTAAKEVVEKYGYVTHVVNAAGYVLCGALEESSPEEDLSIFTTNVFGTLNVIKAFLPYLRTASGPARRTLATFGSMASWVSEPGYVVYASTKFAISGITEGLHAELKSFGIKATVIEPGYFRTGLLSTDAKVKAKNVIKEYADTPAGLFRKAVDGASGQQIGDVVKGAKVIVDVLTGSGSAEGKDVPVRLLLGSDVQKAVRGKLRDTEVLIGEWEGIASKTDHD